MVTATRSKTFFCEAHLETTPIKNQSADPRYCNACFVFLGKEAGNYEGRRPWMPHNGPIKERAKKDTSINGQIRRLQKTAALTKSTERQNSRTSTKKQRKPTQTPPKRNTARQGSLNLTEGQ